MLSFIFPINTQGSHFSVLAVRASLKALKSHSPVPPLLWCTDLEGSCTSGTPCEPRHFMDAKSSLCQYRSWGEPLKRKGKETPGAVLIDFPYKQISH